MKGYSRVIQEAQTDGPETKTDRTLRNTYALQIERRAHKTCLYYIKMFVCYGSNIQILQGIRLVGNLFFLNVSHSPLSFQLRPKLSNLG